MQPILNKVSAMSLYDIETNSIILSVSMKDNINNVTKYSSFNNKIKCEYCGRYNDNLEEVCKSCSALLNYT